MQRRDRIEPMVAGIFVGGNSSRMGGLPKGLLASPADGTAETIVARWRRIFGALGVTSLLVGRRAAYDALRIEGIDDDPPGIGPLGGLVALLKRARGGRAIAVACDMPFVSQTLLAKLIAHPSDAPALAARQGGVWEPLFARYDGSRALETAERHARAGRHSLRGVLDALDTEELVLSEDEWSQIRDWDAPGDVC